MAINEITGANMITKSSSTYADNFDAIFRSKKVYYTIEYDDGYSLIEEFTSEIEAQIYFDKNKDTIVFYEKQELLQE